MPSQHHELSYASPVQSNKPQNPGHDSRQRRSHESSTDDETRTHVENFINTDYRAGGPYLPTLPVKIDSPRDRQYNKFEALRENPHYNVIRGILEKWKIEIRDYGIAMQRAEHYPEDTPIPTLRIMAEKHHREGEEWVNAALEIRSYLIQQGFSDMNIEISDPQLTSQDQGLCFPVQNTDPIYPLWERICEMIIETVDLTNCRILECFRYGFSESTSPPTIIVTVSRESNRKWKGVREAIIDILNQFGLDDVAVRISTGDVCFAGDGTGKDIETNPEIPETAWGDTAKLGVSLGGSDDLYGSATLGGFVELMVDKEKRKWCKFGVTCYLAVLPGLCVDYGRPGSKTRQLDGWNRNGVPFSTSGTTTEKHLWVIQPSERDTNYQLGGLDNNISCIESTEIYQDRSKKLKKGELFDPDLRVHLAQNKSLAALKALKAKISGHCKTLGSVSVASGVSIERSRAQGSSYLIQLDWALIEMISGRMGNNSINAYGTPKFGLPDTVLYFPRQPVENLEVFKLGRTTKWTKGRFNGLRSAYITTSSNEHGREQMVVTKEYCVTGIGGPFSLKGDEGALVFDRDLRVVGMVFSSSLMENASYITLWDDICEDIKRRTGAVDAHIAD